MTNITGILFDSGDTLVFPKSGSWWPGPDFEHMLHLHGISTSQLHPEKLKRALDEGEKYLDANSLAPDIEKERMLFRKYYQVVLNNLDLIGDDSGLANDLALAYVDGCNIELFPDTVPVLKLLYNKGLSLGIVSDAWPSLENKYSLLGIRMYFKSFTISAKVGCYKPNNLMYETAIAEIGIEPEKLLFVDNDIESVKAAVRLGMGGVVLERQGKEVINDEITFLPDLHRLVEWIKRRS